MHNYCQTPNITNDKEEEVQLIHLSIDTIVGNNTAHSACEKLQATRAKVAPVNLIYGSHFSATEATNIVSQNMRNFVEFTRTFTRIAHSQSQYKAYLYSRVYIFTLLNSNQLLFIFYESHGILPYSLQWRV